MDRYSALYYFLVPGSTAWKCSDRDLPALAATGLTLEAKASQASQVA